MRLILDLFRRIFEALQGVYTKAESDAALALKADATALTEESQAREQADTKHDTEIDWLKTAVDGDWKTYTLYRAALTVDQSNVDLVNEVIADYANDETNVVARQLVDNWKMLTAYVALVGESGGTDPLTNEFWVEYFKATKEYKKDPTATETWTATENPYLDGLPDIVVNFSLSNGTSAFRQNANISGKNSIIFAPNLNVANSMFFISGFAGTLIAPNLKTAYSTFNSSKVISWTQDLLSLTDGREMFVNSKALVRFYAKTPLVSNGRLMFQGTGLSDYKGGGFPLLTEGTNMFLNAKLNSSIIAFILDSLPSDPVGKGGTGVITFTGCPGAAELTQESESVAAAIAKGWTVEL